MDTPAASYFPETRRTLDRLDEWVTALASPLLPPQQVAVELQHISAFQWDFREKTDRAVLIGKSVRLVSGIRVAFLLADLGYIGECGTILRTVSDFSTEIISICEGSKKGTPTTAQAKFIEQYFKHLPKNPDEYDDVQTREKWVARDELFKAHCRWASENNRDPEPLRKALRYLAHMYDKFVHGAYITSMELCDERDNKFMLRGHESPEKREVYKRAVASKLHEAVTALASIAELANMPALVQEICSAGLRLYNSGELS